MLSRVNSHKSECFIPQDRERIFDAIERLVEGGFTRLDNMVFVVFETWMINVLKEKIKINQENNNEEEQIEWEFTLASLYRDQGKYDLAEPLYMRCIESSKRILGDDHPSTLSSINNLALCRLKARQRNVNKSSCCFIL
jgi:hypothetical protein